MRLEGKVALISGGGSGIGAATARLFAAEGAKVVVTGRRPEPIEAVATDIAGVAVAGDTSDPAHAVEAVAAAVATFGGLDVVVANAGSGFGGSVGTLDDEHWQRMLDVNLTGPLVLTRAALPAMLERDGGSIILVSSVSGLAAMAGSAAYVTTKTGLLGLARSIAVDYGPRGIRANALCPGWVRTDMGDRAMDKLAARDGITRDAAYLEATGHAPLRRPGEPEEIAACCLFLASDASSFVTGAVLVADGGSTAADVGGLAFDTRRWDSTP